MTQNKNKGMLGKHHSEETKKKISNSRLGIPSWNKGLTKETDERVKKCADKITGRKFSEETNKKIRISEARKRLVKCFYCGNEYYKYIPLINKHDFCNRDCYKRWKSENMTGKNNHRYGKHHTEETKEKIRKSLKGHPSYNEERNKKVSERTKEAMKSESIREKISKARRGIPNKKTGETLKRLYKEGKLVSYMKGKKLKIESRKKISIKLKEYYQKNKHPRLGKHHSKESIEKYKEWRKTKVIPLKDTKIEVKIQDLLKQLGYDFFTHQYIKEIEHGYQCDILIPALNLVIECDGDYWLKYPIGRDIDHIRTKELLEKGFKVLRLWEREIKVMGLEEFKIKMQNIGEKPI